MQLITEGHTAEFLADGFLMDKLIHLLIGLNWCVTCSSQLPDPLKEEIAALRGPACSKLPKTWRQCRAGGQGRA